LPFFFLFSFSLNYTLNGRYSEFSFTARSIKADRLGWRSPFSSQPQASLRNGPCRSRQGFWKGFEASDSTGGLVYMYGVCRYGLLWHYTGKPQFDRRRALGKTGSIVESRIPGNVELEKGGLSGSTCLQGRYQQQWLVPAVAQASPVRALAPHGGPLVAPVSPSQLAAVTNCLSLIARGQPTRPSVLPQLLPLFLCSQMQNTDLL
jgi:hypothetical protein